MADGEPGLNIDNNLVKYGDGETPWNGLIYTGEDIPPYRGFKASYGRVYDNDSSDETTLSKIVIYKESVTPIVTIDDDGGDSDLFKVDGLMGSDFVAMFVLYGDTNGPKATSLLLRFVRIVIDNVIYDNQGQIRNINNLRSAFYDQNTILHNSAGGLISNFQFLNGGNWPTEYISDGGNDQYDGANYIYTDITGDGYIGSSTGAVPYNGGNINDGTSYFGSGSNYVVTYQDSIFGLFVTGANFNSINTNGGSGADSRSTTDCGSLFDVGFVHSSNNTGNGLQGTQGVQGLQGPSNGPEGSQGVQGIIGNQGLQGLTGEPGSSGTQGVQGLTGEPGSPGEPGIQGVQGLTGDPGSPGEPGIQGLTGDPGSPGSPGEPGIQGTEGSQGLQGLQGPSPTVAYGSTIRSVSVTSPGTATVTIDFSQDGIILIKDPTNSPTIAFTNITAGKRCSVIIQNTTTDSIIVNTGVAADQAVSGSNSVLNRGRQSTFLEYVCYSNVSTGVFLIVDPY